MTKRDYWAFMWWMIKDFFTFHFKEDGVWDKWLLGSFVFAAIIFVGCAAAVLFSEVMA